MGIMYIYISLLFGQQEKEKERDKRKEKDKKKRRIKENKSLSTGLWCFKKKISHLDILGKFYVIHFIKLPLF
jgi:hypothetical protein